MNYNENTKNSNNNNNDNNINDGCTPSATNESRFIDVFSEEKLSLSEEQARDDDMPSTSVLVVGTPCEFPAASTLNVKNDSEGNTTIPPTSTTIPCSKSVESHQPITGRVSKRKKKRKRGGRKPPQPALGCPGGLNDPRRVGMSGATVKWYLRHLQAGKTPDEANELALGRNSIANHRESTATNCQQDFKIVPAVQQIIPVTAIWGSVLGASATYQDKTGHAEKRKGEQITPELLPSPKKQRQYLHQQTTQLKGEQNSASKPTHAVEKQRRCLEVQKDIRIAVLPLNYPAEAMAPEQLTALQDKIMDEVLKGWRHALSFCGVFFRSGLLLVDCKNEETATWLTEVAPKLEGWEGPVLSTRRGEEIPQMHKMTALLYRSAHKSVDFALGLIKAQNEGINTTAWRIVTSDIEGSNRKLIIDMDDESYKYIKKQGFRLNYRFSAISMWPLKPTSKVERDEVTEFV